MRGCHVWRAGPVDVPLCLGLDAGVTRGSGFGLATVNTASRWWGALESGPALTLALRKRLAIWIDVDATPPFLRAGFNVRNRGTRYTTPPVAGMVWAGCEIRLSH